MTNAAARSNNLFVGIELSKNSWRLAFSDGAKIRQRTLPAGDQAALQQELAWSKQKLGLSADCAVRSCYETGRDGFWVQRLQAILDRGKAEGLFRPDLDGAAATLALMVQLKGVAHHVSMGERRLK